MKLIIAIVQDDYITKLIKALMDNKIRATKLSSTGGFLKSGNTTLFIGVEDKEIDKVVDLIKEECSSKKVKDGNNEITLGGANLFVVDIDKYMKI
ncbi:cyclic-di-AMP receptor [Tissierella sp. MB52-C2]|uniref:cyclic-di-AMP receptor n=1 Tax=Tissierella sp. MB52-C2 TaxID=3070999 RepID=UPI00280B7F94|nr:cyclic-di-AMP receptor [Tissierella sp. MB52-C2]WMM24405.1 cyclic-di-AMP receptor [Tissierella sp. MB52-C2]